MDIQMRGRSLAQGFEPDPNWRARLLGEVEEGASSGGGELMVAASGGDQRGCSIA